MNDLKISTRISLGYLVITLAFLVLSGITAWLMESVSQSASRMEAETELLHLADLWQANVRQNSARSLAVAYSDGSALLDFFKAGIKETTEQTSETQKAFLALVRDPDSRQRAAAVGGNHSWIRVADQLPDEVIYGGNHESRSELERTPGRRRARQGCDPESDRRLEGAAHPDRRGTLRAGRDSGEGSGAEAQAGPADRIAEPGAEGTSRAG